MLRNYYTNAFQREGIETYSERLLPRPNYRQVETTSHSLSKLENASLAHLEKFHRRRSSFASSNAFQPRSPRFILIMNSQSPPVTRQLATLLYAHSFGLPLVIYFNSQNSDSIREATGIRGIFHCPTCLGLWITYEKLPSTCNEEARFIRGPTIPLSTSEAATLVYALRWSNKISSVVVQEALPFLQKASSEKEAHRIFKSVTVRNNSIALGSPALNRVVKTMIQLKRNEQLSSSIAYSMRLSLTNQSKGDLKLDEVKQIGMQSPDGSFYPGFFSKARFLSQENCAKRIANSSGQTSNNDIPQTVMNSYWYMLPELSLKLGNLPFVAREHIDAENQQHIFGDNACLSCRMIQFPTLYQLLQYDSIGSVNNSYARQKNDNDSGCQFVVQNGFQINLKELFASGLWHAREGNEFYLTGVFNNEGHFKAAYCITSDGYLVPGTTTDAGKFMSMSKYDADGNIVTSYHSSCLQLKYRGVLERMEMAPNCPRVDELQKKVNLVWFCVKNGRIVVDPGSVSVFSDGIFYESEKYNVYVGGEVGPDQRLYLYGRYKNDGSFYTGGSSLMTDVKLKCMNDNASSGKKFGEDLMRKVGIFLRKNVSFKAIRSIGEPGLSNAWQRQQSAPATPPPKVNSNYGDMVSRSQQAIPKCATSETIGSKYIYDECEESSRSTSMIEEKLFRRKKELLPCKRHSAGLEKFAEYQQSADALEKSTSKGPSIVQFRTINGGKEMKKILATTTGRPNSASEMKLQKETVLNPAVRNRTGKPTTRPGCLADLGRRPPREGGRPWTACGYGEEGDISIHSSPIYVEKRKIKGRHLYRRLVSHGSWTNPSTRKQLKYYTDIVNRRPFSANDLKRNVGIKAHSKKSAIKLLKSMEQKESPTPTNSLSSTSDIQSEFSHTEEENISSPIKQINLRLLDFSSEEQNTVKVTNAFGGDKSESKTLRDYSFLETEDGLDSVSQTDNFESSQVNDLDEDLQDDSDDQEEAAPALSNTAIELEEDHLNSDGGSSSEDERYRNGKEVKMRPSAILQLHLEEHQLRNLLPMKPMSSDVYLSRQRMVNREMQRRSSSRSLRSPSLNKLSVLNFTQNFSFSYFTLPGHFREYNNKIKKGSLDLLLEHKKETKQKKRVGSRTVSIYSSTDDSEVRSEASSETQKL